MIDLLWTCAYATVTSPNHCVRPEFSDTTAIKQGYHPILQLLATSSKMTEPFIPNDVYLHNAANFLVITGPNMV